MATNIDERIVAAKFDASDFEKGVDKTLKKLDELKKSLDLKDATNGVKELAEKTEASTDSMSKSLEKLTERFTTFVGMIKQRILGGLADEVANVFLKMEQSVTRFIRSISTDQISSGMQKYQSMLTSVRQMVNAGYDQSQIEKVLERTRLYSDETSYSFEQMADAMSKMTAAGVDLDTAGKAVEGIANACANAGINANDASRAFYNLSQAYSKGKLEYTDYRSLELLNMTTKEFKEQMLEAGVAAGTLEKKVDKSGKTIYKTTNKLDKKVKSGKVVNAKNLSDMLKYDWMNTEAMNALFGKAYWMEVIDKDTLAEMRKELGDEEFEKRFGKIASQAYQAAYEARSFVDVINAVKDAVSSRWATTFETLFGKLEQAKNFFTDLANGELADVVYKIGDYRNAILDFWDDGINGIDSGGGEVFRQTIVNITEALGTLLKTVLDLLPGFREFDKSEDAVNPGMQSLSDKLFMLTMRIRDFSLRLKDGAERFREFMNSPIMENGPTRIELIRETLTNLGSVLSIFARVASIAFNTIVKALNVLNPIFDGFLVLLSKVTSPLTNLKNDTKVFKDIEYSIDNIFTVLNPIAEVLGKVVGFLGEVGAFFAQMAIDTVTSNIEFFADAIGLVFELFTNNSAQMKDGEGVLARIQADFEGIKTACQAGLNALKEFFGTLLGDIRRLLGLTDEAEKKSGDQNGGIFSGLTNFFNTNQFVQDAKAWVNQAIVDVTAFIKSIPSRVMQLGGNIYDTLRGLFFKDETNNNGSQIETKTVLTPLGEWVNQAIIDIKNFFISLPQRIIDGVGKITNWIDEVFNYWFAEQKNINDNITSYKMENGEWKQTDTIFASRFEQFIANAKISISKWFEDLPNKIRNAFSSIGNFASNLYKSLDEFLFGKKVGQTISVADGKGGLKYKDVTVRYKSGFSKWLDGVIKDIKKFISNIPEYIKSGIRGAGDIINTIISALFGKEDGKEVTSKDVTESLEKPFLGIDLGSILNTIAGIGREILNQIARIFTGTDDIDKNMNWFSETIAKGINWIREKAIEGLNWLSTTLAELPTTIANLFSHENKDNANAGPVGTAIIGFGEAIGTFITVTLPDKILELIDNATNAFDNIWNELYNKIVGGAEESSEEVVDGVASEIDAMSSAAPAVKKPELSAWEKFVEKLGQTMRNIWKNLPTWIAEGIDLAILGIDELISGFTDRIAEANAKKKASETTGEVFEEVTKGMADSAKEGEASEEPALLKAINGIGERIRDLFVITIPGFISEAWTVISNLGGDIYKGISSAFTGEPVGEDASELTQMANNAGATIKTFLVEKVPAWFKTAWKEISTTAKDIFAGVSSIFTGATPVGEVQTAVNKFGTIIYKAITEDIPAAIKRAFDYIKGLFTKKDPLEENLKLLPDSERAYVSRYVDKMKKDTKKAVEDEAGNSESWSFIDGIKEGFLNAFNSIGPAILNGLATALEWLNNIGAVIIDIISGKTSIGEEIEKAYGEEKPELVTSLTRVGESLKTFFIDTLPKFIGAAIASLIQNADEWFSKLFGAMGASAKAEEEEFIDGLAGNNGGGGGGHSFEVENALDFMGILKKIFESIMNWVGENKTVLEIIGVIIALTMLFSKLTDLFGLADEFEEGARAIKWTGITLAIIAISGIFSYISSLVNSGDENKIENFKSIIEKLGGLLEKVAWIMGLLTVGKIADALGNKWDDSSKPAADIVGKLSDGLGSFFKAFGVGAGTYVAGGFINATIDTTFDTIGSAFTALVSDVEDAVSLVDPAITKLMEMDDKLDKATSAVQKIGNLFTEFDKALKELYSKATGGTVYETNSPNAVATWGAKSATGERIATGPYEEIVSLKAYMKDLETNVDLFVKLSEFINYLANALNKIDNVSDIEATIEDVESLIRNGKLTNFMVDLLNMLKTSIESSHMSPELLGGQFASRTSGMALALEMLADSLSIFATGISGFNEDSLFALNETLEIFTKLSEAVNGANFSQNSLAKIFIGDTTLSKIGSEIKIFGNQMKLFYGYVSNIPGFEKNEVDKTKRIVDGMVEVLTKIATAAKSVTDYSAGFMLNDINQYLPAFGESLGKLFTNINDHLSKNISSDRLSQLTSMVGSISIVIQAMTELARISIDRDNFDISSMLDAIFLGFGGEDQKKQNENIDKLSTILILFNKAIQKSLISEEAAKDYEEVGTILAKRLFTGIQSALDSDPTLRITPVLNLDTAKGQLKQLFGIEELENVDLSSLARSAAGANSIVDEERVKASELYGKIGEVASAINDLKDSQTTLEQLTTAFSKLKMYINKNVLVGEITDDIDYRIGLKIDLVNGNITP